jgi:hypothetical protein
MDSRAGNSHDEHKPIKTNRLINKFFGKEKKPVNNEEDIAAFLHRPSDKLYMTGTEPTPPPKLARIDTSNARRWPTASEVRQLRDTSRGPSPKPPRKNKGLVVRFVETKPEVIGEGGDEAEASTSQIIGCKKRTSSQQRNDGQSRLNITEKQAVYELKCLGHQSENGGLGQAVILERSTGTKPSTESQTANPSRTQNQNKGESDCNTGPSAPSSSFHSRSFSARKQAEMRDSEARALLADRRSVLFSASDDNAGRASTESQRETRNQPQNELLKPIALPVRGYSISQPSAGIYPRNAQRPGSANDHYGMPLPSPAIHPQHPQGATATEALQEFSNRVQHLYKIFQLSAESVAPLSSASVESLLRVASWWFLKGRMSIENAIKRRSSTNPQAHGVRELQQQGNADLAKSLWIIEDILPQRSTLGYRHLEDLHSNSPVTPSDGVEGSSATSLDRCHALYNGLQKLTASMMRNNFMPPGSDDAPLAQGLDTSIWIKYPATPLELQSILSGNGRSSSSNARRSTSLATALPLGDTKINFVFARMLVDLFLVENGQESLNCHWPCIVSVQRCHLDKDLGMSIATQNDLIGLHIQSSKGSRPSMNDVRWDTKGYRLEIKLLDKFWARIQCTPQDFDSLWNIYDYTKKIHSNFHPREDEKVIFDHTVKSGQYFQDGVSTIFPKDPVPKCQLRVFEKTVKESSSSGIRPRHRGLRFAVITNSETRSLSGISHELPSGKPIRYDLMRGEGGHPALLISFYDWSQAVLILTFATDSDRHELYSSMIGGQRHDEESLIRAPINAFALIETVSPSSSITAAGTGSGLAQLSWSNIQVINYKDSDKESDSIYTSGRCRIIIETKNKDSITDRINIGPGELRIQLNTTSNELSILRQPQKDMTIAISKARVSDETCRELEETLHVISTTETIRKYIFPSISDLHAFQEAVTGFSVMYDGIAETFAISRRRMVVPIYKKWEAMNPRLQILERNNSLQVAVFFKNFSHAECMNFAIKASDVFENVNKGDRFYVKLTDAKFPLGKAGEEGGGAEKDFVCLDIPDYPGEHDDISIGFDTEDGLWLTCSLLYTMKCANLVLQIEIGLWEHFQLP